MTETFKINNPDALDELLATLQDAANRKKFNKLAFFTPYPKQRLFLDGGSIFRERLLMAGNQQGKTECGAAETAYHLTGRYPPDWKGRKWSRPTIGWAAGETGTVVRDVQQAKLCGPPGVEAEFGTGYIPKECFADKPTLARGVADAYDMVQVWHETDGVRDGVSTLNFKSYEQGRTKFQGKGIDFGWADEEPPEDVYSEFLTRTVATGGMMYMTFTPLKGRSAVVIRFTDEISPDRLVVNMTIEDAQHISPAERQKILDGYLAHEREARANGVPLLGSGKIFTTPEAAIAEDINLEMIPREWAKMWALDFGIGHPFAAVLGAWDKDADIIHILHAFRAADQLPIQHAAAMKPIGINIPVAWPQDGTAREKSGETVSKLYKNQGLLMLPDHATWPDGGNSTEAGILEMDERFKSGKLRVAKWLADWFEEYRFYHRKDGLIVKVKDDIMSATRIFVMAKRYARPGLLGGMALRRRKQTIANDVDFDLFSGY